MLAHADEITKLPPSQSIGIDSDPQKIAHQIYLLFGEIFTKKLLDRLRAEAPLSIPEII